LFPSIFSRFPPSWSFLAFSSVRLISQTLRPPLLFSAESDSAPPLPAPSCLMYTVSHASRFSRSPQQCFSTPFPESPGDICPAVGLFFPFCLHYSCTDLFFSVCLSLHTPSFLSNPSLGESSNSRDRFARSSIFCDVRCGRTSLAWRDEYFPRPPAAFCLQLC